MNTPFESVRHVKLQGILLLAVVFVIGVFAGMAFERVREARPALRLDRGQGGPPAWREQFGLTAEQDRQIYQILERNRPRAEAIVDQFLPLLRAVTDSVRVEVRAVLTPDQQKEFDRLHPRLVAHPRDGRPPSGGLRHHDRPRRSDHPPSAPLENH